MKGYTPNLPKSNKKELNSKEEYSFIELGIRNKCKNNCQCDKCKK